MENKMSVDMKDVKVIKNEEEGDYEASISTTSGEVIYGYGETEPQAVEDLRMAIYFCIRGE